MRICYVHCMFKNIVRFCASYRWIYGLICGVICGPLWAQVVTSLDGDRFRTDQTDAKNCNDLAHYSFQNPEQLNIFLQSLTVNEQNTLQNLKNRFAADDSENFSKINLKHAQLLSSTLELSSLTPVSVIDFINPLLKNYVANEYHKTKDDLVGCTFLQHELCCYVPHFIATKKVSLPRKRTSRYYDLSSIPNLLPLDHCNENWGTDHQLVSSPFPRILDKIFPRYVQRRISDSYCSTLKSEIELPDFAINVWVKDAESKSPLIDQKLLLTNDQRLIDFFVTDVAGFGNYTFGLSNINKLSEFLELSIKEDENFEPSQLLVDAKMLDQLLNEKKLDLVMYRHRKVVPSPTVIPPIDPTPEPSPSDILPDDESWQLKWDIPCLGLLYKKGYRIYYQINDGAEVKINYPQKGSLVQLSLKEIDLNLATANLKIYLKKNKETVSLYDGLLREQLAKPDFSLSCVSIKKFIKMGKDNVLPAKGIQFSLNKKLQTSTDSSGEANFLIFNPMQNQSMLQEKNYAEFEPLSPLNMITTPGSETQKNIINVAKECKSNGVSNKIIIASNPEMKDEITVESLPVISMSANKLVPGRRLDSKYNEYFFSNYFTWQSLAPNLNWIRIDDSHNIFASKFMATVCFYSLKDDVDFDFVAGSDNEGYAILDDSKTKIANLTNYYDKNAPKKYAKKIAQGQHCLKFIWINAEGEKMQKLRLKAKKEVSTSLSNKVINDYLFSSIDPETKKYVSAPFDFRTLLGTNLSNLDIDSNPSGISFKVTITSKNNSLVNPDCYKKIKKYLP